MEESLMKKVFKMQDLDCANCAAKMEAAINKISGVQKATMNFMTQKLTIEAEEAGFDRILEEAQKAVAKVDRDCSIIR